MLAKEGRSHICWKICGLKDKLNAIWPKANEIDQCNLKEIYVNAKALNFSQRMDILLKMKIFNCYKTFICDLRENQTLDIAPVFDYRGPSEDDYLFVAKRTLAANAA